MNVPRAGATVGGTGATSRDAATKSSGAKSSEANAAKAGAAGGAMKWAALAGGGALLLGGFLLLGGRPTSSPVTNQPGGTGQGRGSTTTTAPGKLTVFVGADVSKSVTPSIRESSMDGLKFVLKQAVPGGTMVHFVFYDTNARTQPNTVEFYEPRDLDEVGAAFKTYNSRPEKGTTQAFALQRLRKEAANLPGGTPYAFVLITDGEDYDKPATKQQAQELSEKPEFRGLMVIGAQMESKDRIYLRDQIQDSLEPLGKRRLVCGPEVSEHDTDTFQSMMSSE
jgi:hypothetical protein